MNTRRDFLKHSSSGFGYLAFAALAQQEALRGSPAATSVTGPLAPRSPHFAARAKHVIFLCMQGGPSHVDMLDYKPKLTKVRPRERGGGGDGAEQGWDRAPIAARLLGGTARATSVD